MLSWWLGIQILALGFLSLWHFGWDISFLCSLVFIKIIKSTRSRKSKNKKKYILLVFLSFPFQERKKFTVYKRVNGDQLDQLQLSLSLKQRKETNYNNSWHGFFGFKVMKIRKTVARREKFVLITPAINDHVWKSRSYMILFLLLVVMKRKSKKGARIWCTPYTCW